MLCDFNHIQNRYERIHCNVKRRCFLYAVLFVRHGHCLCSRRAHIGCRKRVFTTRQHLVCAAVRIVCRYFQSRSIKRVAYRISCFRRVLRHLDAVQNRYERIHCDVKRCRLFYAVFLVGHCHCLRTGCTHVRSRQRIFPTCQHLIRAAVGIVRRHFEPRRIKRVAHRIRCLCRLLCHLDTVKYWYRCVYCDVKRCCLLYAAFFIGYSNRLRAGSAHIGRGKRVLAARQHLVCATIRVMSCHFKS
ncbi:hypothetical protein CHK_1663 [Christensenella hongkongensis]|uniref:Uncharacterized protein n=1 Tax=Christensenella hongkongensis TaxID=270498 RepID=A0A0M2NFA4_9FIRM|nr:hypothetical protein CHK_1663 [Christensenella hongkongensis]